MLLFFSSLTLAIAQDRTITIRGQTPVIPPHRSSTDLLSLRSWQAEKAESLTRKFVDGEVVRQNYAYHDTFGFRITGKKKSHTRSAHHLFLNGCSWTYGSGVDGQATFAALLEDQLNIFRVVNMGARGGSPNEALYLWRNFFWDRVYPEKSGYLVYTIFGDHYERVKRTWRYLHWAPHFSPVFDENLEHSVPSFEFLDFKVAKLIRDIGLDNWWLRLTSHFNQGNPEEFNTTIVQYMRAIKTQYLLRFPQGRFIITWMNFTSPNFSPQETVGFKKALDKAGIEYWEPSTKLSQPEENYRIPRDGHPSELAHREHAQFIHAMIATSELAKKGKK